MTWQSVSARDTRHSLGTGREFLVKIEGEQRPDGTWSGRADSSRCISTVPSLAPGSDRKEHPCLRDYESRMSKGGRR